VALLNNRDLQALYGDWACPGGVGPGWLLQNPVFDGAGRFPVRGGPLALDLSAAVHFLDIFYVPLRKRVAAARLEDVKLQVTGTVLRLRRDGADRFLPPSGE